MPTFRHQFHGLPLELLSICSPYSPHVDHLLGEHAPPFSRCPLFRGKIILTHVNSSIFWKIPDFLNGASSILAIRNVSLSRLPRLRPTRPAKSVPVCKQN